MNIITIRNLSFFGAIFTLVVISIGAWVRLTYAGLGCPDWPGCYGILGTPDTMSEIAKAKELYPNAIIDSGKAWREMLHRYLAGMLGLYVFFISFLTFKYVKNINIYLPISLVLLIIIQSLLGMLTVTELVKPTIVTMHLLFGMITASLLLWNGLKISEQKGLHNKPINIYILICALALTLQIILGGWTSTNYASLACTDFPKCTEEWWPSDMNFIEGFTIINLPDVNYETNQIDYKSKLAIHFTHRLGALILTFLFIGLFLYLFIIQNSIILKKIGIFVLVFFVIQILLGISNILFSLPITIAVMHTVNACILLMSMIILLFYSTYNEKKW
tara:strand:- start:4914 stop:5909 length:996 start_codon:yes stop_codon:yes gene_type:complete